MPHRFHWRIFLPYLILLVVMVAILCILGIHHIRQEEEALWQTHLLNTAQLIASQAQEHYGTQGEVFLLSDLANKTSTISGLSITFLDMEGHILGSSIPLSQLPDDPLTLPAAQLALSEGQKTQVTKQLIAAAVTVRSANNQGLGIVQLQAPLSYFQIDLSRIYWLTVVMILISTLALVVLTLITQDRSFRPIEKLTIAAQQMSMGNFNHLDFPETPNDLHDLSQALKVMAQQLDDQINTLTSERTKLSAVLNQMTDGVLIADTEGHVQLLNPTAERLFQIKEKAGLGRSVVEVLRYHQLVELWQTAKNGERESTMLEIGPQHLFLQVVGIPLKTALPGSTLLLFQDLTQLRRLETVRRDFISNVSHELRTPLASLKALAETLQEGALDDPPAARRFILRMETEIDNLTQLVNELLELSRIESGKVPLSFNRILPCDLLRPAYERMALQAERAGQELSLECQPDLPAVFADPDRITQVLINLVHNAIKFTLPDGKITISAYRDGDHIVFFVRDTGVGIARKDLGRIFERFYKADRARTGGGTGLGLSIARHMIETHGGYIWAESEEKIGSTFYFSLPIA